MTFHRARHLLFAGIGLLHAPLVPGAVALVVFVVGALSWTVEAFALAILAPMCFAVFVAWLALQIFDTHSDVTIFPRRFADIGLLVILAALVQELVVVSILCKLPAADIERLAAPNFIYTGPSGQLLLGWLTLVMVAGSIAEEIVYRALLLRALEGYTNHWLALILHALVFEFVHIFVYGNGFQGGIWFIGALVLGYAFQRTRSLAVPVLMHAAHNIMVTALVWYLAR